MRYERVAWNLKPVMWAHEILVRYRFEQAAATWRRSLAERIGEKADIYVTKLRALQREYSMRMPTVADRILERFIQPMTIDRMRAMVEPATLDAEANRESVSFELLEREADELRSILLVSVSTCLHGLPHWKRRLKWSPSARAEMTWM